MRWRVPTGFEGIPMRMKGLLRDLEGFPVGLGTWVLWVVAVLEVRVAYRG